VGFKDIHYKIKTALMRLKNAQLTFSKHRILLSLG